MSFCLFYSLQKIDENFNPIDIHPASIDYLSDIFQMSSIASRLNQLGKLEESDANATRTTAPTTQHLNVSTSRPCHLNLSSERSSDVVRLSSNGHHCGPHSIDSCTKQISGEQATEQSVDTVGSSSNLARKGTRDSRDSDNLENMAVTSQPHRCSCVTMESTGSARQTYGRHFRQSSVGTLESEWMHFDLTGSGLTDTSGYITCISTHDHLEEMEQSCTWLISVC